MERYLPLKWSTSRGRDTYGWNIVTLTDTTTGKRYRTNGGGYDMIGTIYGEWLADVYQDRLLGIADRASTSMTNGEWSHQENGDSFYGMYHYDASAPNGEHVSLDGACGFESMRRIADAIGLKTRNLVNRHGSTDGFIVIDTTESGQDNE